MKIFSATQVRELDNITIKTEPISSIDLMERAASRLFKAIIKDFENTSFLIIAGPGNNGGDGVVLARLLKAVGRNIKLCVLDLSSNFSNDLKINIDRYRKLNTETFNFAKSISSLPKIDNETIIVDAIFGSGLSKPIVGEYANIINHLNNLDNKIISVDSPSGLFGEDNSKNTGAIIEADVTYTLEFPSLSFCFPENNKYVGNLSIVKFGLHPNAINKTHTNYNLFSLSDIKLKSRDKFSHKGNNGHALLLAGTKGKLGAAVLSSKSCLKSGCGLLTTHTIMSAENVFHIALPECMLSIDKSDEIITEYPDLCNYNAIGIGPGVGKNIDTKNVIENILDNYNIPMVLDADALNIIAEHNLLKKLPINTIITPHIGEFRRLFGDFENSYQRLNIQVAASKKYNIIIVCKGAYTSITLPNGKVYFNTTGNPGMATAGSGDVLTGIILSLLAQSYAPYQAALYGVCLHGAAGDFALHSQTVETLIASDIINNLPQVFKILN